MFTGTCPAIVTPFKRGAGDEMVSARLPMELFLPQIILFLATVAAWSIVLIRRLRKPVDAN